MESLATWMRSISASVGQSLDCLDLFGASGRVARTWQDGGYDSTSFDIKINPGDDITCVGGFKRFLRLGLKCPDSKRVGFCSSPMGINAFCSDQT